MAGIAGALTAQTSKVANLVMLDFSTSAGVVVMDRAGRVLAVSLVQWSAMSVHDHSSHRVDSESVSWVFSHWCDVIGVLVVLPEGLVGLGDGPEVTSNGTKDREAQGETLRDCRQDNLCHSFGGLAVRGACRFHFQRARERH